MKYFFVYVLESQKDGNWYTGYTQDLKNRIKEHNEGLVKSTSHRIPFKLIYAEISLHQYDAIPREKYLKSGPGKRYLKRRLKRYLNSL